MDKNKFTVVPKYEKPPDFIEKLKKLNDSLPVSEVNVSLDKVSLEQLLSNLKTNLDKKPSWFIFMRHRENEKIRIESEKVELLYQQMNSLRKTGREFLELKADAIFSSELLRLLVEDRRLEFINQMELKIKQHEGEIHKLDIDKRRRENEILVLELERAKLRAEIDLLNAKTDQEKEIANLLKAMVVQVNDDMSNAAVVSLFHDLMNRYKTVVSNTENRDFEFDEFLREFRKKMMNENLKQTKAETKIHNSKANLEEYKTKNKMKDDV